MKRNDGVKKLIVNEVDLITINQLCRFVCMLYDSIGVKPCSENYNFFGRIFCNNAISRKVWMILLQIKKMCLDKLQRFFDFSVRRKISDMQKFMELLCLKYVYIVLTVMILRNESYSMSDGYHIEFIFWKECVASVVFILVTGIFLKMRIRNFFPRVLTIFLYILYYIPINSAYAINNREITFFVLSNSYFIFLIILVWAFDKLFYCWDAKSGTNNKSHEGELLRNRHVNLFCFVVCVILIVYKVVFNGFNFLLTFDSNVVYERRAQYATFFESISGTLIAYVLTLVQGVAGTASLFYLMSGLVRKSSVAIITAVLCVLSVYSLSAGKAILLMAGLVIALYILYSLDLLKNIERVFIYSMFLLFFVCIVEYVIRKESSVFMLIIRREMYMPAWLNGLYYDFFSKNNKILWSDNVLFLQNILKPVYDLSPLELISNAYFKGLMPSPNTGLFAEAYMQFGLIGVICYPLLVAGEIVTLGEIYKRFGIAVQTVVAVNLTVSLTNVPLARTDAVIANIVFPLAIVIIPCVAKKLKMESLLDKMSKRDKREENQ